MKTFVGNTALTESVAGTGFDCVIDANVSAAFTVRAPGDGRFVEEGATESNASLSRIVG